MKFYVSPLGSSRTVLTAGKKNTHRMFLDTAALSHRNMHPTDI